MTHPPAGGPPPGWGPPPGYGPQGYGPPGYGPTRPTSVLAVVGLVLALVAPPVGLLLSWLARRETHPVTGTRAGHDLATAGLVLNGVGTGLLVVLLGWFGLQLLGMALSLLPVVLGA